MDAFTQELLSLALQDLAELQRAARGADKLSWSSGVIQDHRRHQAQFLDAFLPGELSQGARSHLAALITVVECGEREEFLAADLADAVTPLINALKKKMPEDRVATLLSSSPHDELDARREAEASQFCKYGVAIDLQRRRPVLPRCMSRGIRLREETLADMGTGAPKVEDVGRAGGATPTRRGCYASRVDPTVAPQITALLRAAKAGGDDVGAELLPLVYGQLRGIAQSAFNAQRGGQTLQPTAVVHEAWLKIAGELGRYENRRHFFAVAAKAMRHVIADAAKAKRREKRGGGAHQVTLVESATPGDAAVDIVELDDALARLAELNPRHAEIVELRFFGSLTVDETAAHLGVSPRTVASDWVMARTWLQRELGRGD